MIPNRKVVGSNPAKDTTRIIFTIIRNKIFVVGVFDKKGWQLKEKLFLNRFKNLTLILKKHSKNFILFLILFKKYSKHFLQLKRSYKKQAITS